MLDYDWTYQSHYCGSLQSPFEIDIIDTNETIDYSRLKPSNPDSSTILFYDENCLYEDEMGDNGSSNFSVKLRVMPFGAFVLVRNFVRVDKVIFKSIEHRYWIEFDNEGRCGKVLREKRVKQMAYGDVLGKVGQQGIKNDALVADQLPISECSTSMISLR